MMESTNSVHPCHIGLTVPSEQFIPDHIFIYMIAGYMSLYDGHREYTIEAGDYCLVKRNHLAKYIKKPPANGKLETVSVFLDQGFLREMSNEYAYTAPHASNNDAVVHLGASPLFENYAQSIRPYLNLEGAERERFLYLKKEEIVLILLKTNPQLKEVLFDFSDPGKIDLEAFMNRNFRFNVSMDRFSYLTGRSLTTFKRDFERIFKNAPGRWLLQKRLEEARFLIEIKGQKPSEVYLEVGFEDLSHFSYAFKKAFGVTPSQLA